MTTEIQALNKELEQLNKRENEIYARIRELEDADKHYYMAILDDMTNEWALREVARCGYCTKSEAEEFIEHTYDTEICSYTIKEISYEENEMLWYCVNAVKAIYSLDSCQYATTENKCKYTEMVQFLKNELDKTKRELRIEHMEIAIE